MALNRRADCAKTGVFRSKTPVFALKVPPKEFRADARKLILFLAVRNTAKNAEISSLALAPQPSGCEPRAGRPFLGPPPCAPANGRPGFPFGFLGAGAGGRLPKAPRRGLILLHSAYSKYTRSMMVGHVMSYRTLQTSFVSGIPPPQTRQDTRAVSRDVRKTAVFSTTSSPKNHHVTITTSPSPKRIPPRHQEFHHVTITDHS